MFSYLAGKWRSDIAIDLGTANTLVFVKGVGIVLEQPSVVAYQKINDKKKIIAIGEEAKQMLGRTPSEIEVIRPLRDGVIADFTVAENMIDYFFKQSTSGWSYNKTHVIVCVPYGSTPVERRAIREAVESAGAKRVGLITEPIAAAIGSGIEIGKSRGSMVVDIGGGTTDIAVISLGGIVDAVSIRAAGDRIDQDIIKYVRSQHSLNISNDTAEQIKKVLGIASAPEDGRGKILDVSGRDSNLNTTKKIQLDQTHIAKALHETIKEICDAVVEILQKTPPAITNDISSTGIMLTGGGANIAELDTVLRKRTNLPVVTADDPLRCVAKGTGQALDIPKDLSHIIHYETKK